MTDRNPCTDDAAAPAAIAIHLALAEMALLQLPSDHQVVAIALAEIRKAHARLIELFPDIGGRPQVPPPGDTH